MGSVPVYGTTSKGRSPLSFLTSTRGPGESVQGRRTHADHRQRSKTSYSLQRSTDYIFTAETRNTLRPLRCLKKQKPVTISKQDKTHLGAKVHLISNCADTDTGFLGKGPRSASNTLRSEYFDARE